MRREEQQRGREPTRLRTEEMETDARHLLAHAYTCPHNNYHFVAATCSSLSMCATQWCMSICGIVPQYVISRGISLDQKRSIASHILTDCNLKA